MTSRGQFMVQLATGKPALLPPLLAKQGKPVCGLTSKLTVDSKENITRTNVESTLPELIGPGNFISHEEIVVTGKDLHNQEPDIRFDTLESCKPANTTGFKEFVSDGDLLLYSDLKSSNNYESESSFYHYSSDEAHLKKPNKSRQEKILTQKEEPEPKLQRATGRTHGLKNQLQGIIQHTSPQSDSTENPKLQVLTTSYEFVSHDDRSLFSDIESSDNYEPEDSSSEFSTEEPPEKKRTKCCNKTRQKRTLLQEEKKKPNQQGGPVGVDEAEIEPQLVPVKTDLGNDCNSKKRKSRNGLSDPQNWERNVQKMKRMRGEQYKGLKKSNGKYRLVEVREKRTLKQPCTCKWSNKDTNTLACSTITEEDREAAFQYFWNSLDDWSGRKAHVASLVEIKEVAQRRKSSLEEGSTQRAKTYKYHLMIRHTRVHVCKKMFLNTLSLGEQSVSSWLKNLSTDICLLADQDAAHSKETSSNLNNSLSQFSKKKRKTKLPLDQKALCVEEFFQSLPKMESHYCRSTSSKLYLEPIWENKMKLFRECQKFCADSNKPIPSWSVFCRVMHKLNIGLYHPKKDQCETCIKYKLSTVSLEEYQVHQKRKESSRLEKQRDKEEAIKNDSLGVYTVDVQAVLLSAYYKTKLKLHNYTIYGMKDGEVFCYLWHEANGNLESDIFASILQKFLTKEIADKNLTNIIIWSDGAAYQNRCEKISNSLLHLSILTGVTIVHKYLEVGHTQMEVDSVHSLIERKMKNKEFYVPIEYIKAIREARVKPKPYNVVALKYTDFYSFSNGYYSCIRPGSKKGDPLVTSIRALRYLPVGHIEYKLTLEDDWELLPRRPKTGVYANLPPLYKTPPRIALNKFEDLQALKKVIHEDYHNFYDNLPHDCEDSHFASMSQCKHIVVTEKV